MRVVLKVFAVLAFFALLVQTTRLAYLRWVEPRTSVLDRYDRPLQVDIANAKSLEELVARYDAVRKAADEKRKERAAAAAPISLNEEPFKSEQELHAAIEDWEAKSKELRELRMYWFIGLVFFVVGILLYLFKSRAVGTVLLILTFADFIYWTSPGSLGTNLHQFELLLTTKLVLSVISFVLLLLALRLLRVFEAAPAAKSATT